MIRCTGTTKKDKRCRCWAKAKVAGLPVCHIHLEAALKLWNAILAGDYDLTESMIGKSAPTKGWNS